MSRNIFLSQEEWQLIYNSSAKLKDYYHKNELKQFAQRKNLCFSRNWWTHLVYKETDNPRIKNILAREEYREQDFFRLAESVMTFSGWYINFIDKTKLNTTEEEWEVLMNRLKKDMDHLSVQKVWEWNVVKYYENDMDIKYLAPYG
jgi:hypothetical protein